ncbi:MAG: IPTL-CTERM sorting domain-containing protein, partial [Acidobacteriota bacterium]|nr:IPTL-CTERM sorting domain-containing protein [Acidobacteriota bacterium]
DLAARINAEDSSVNYSVHILPTNDLGGISLAFLTRAGVVVENLFQIQADVQFTFGDTGPIPLHDRPPLMLQALIEAGGEMVPITVVAVHNRSLNDIDDPDRGPFVRAKRHEQALQISLELQALQDNNPDINLLVLGDFNAFQFTDGYVDALGQITGDPDPLGSLIPATDELDPDLVNLLTLVPDEERYSFIFDGTSQVLDHALASRFLLPGIRGIEYARANADYPEELENDPLSPLRATDHDGLVVFMVPDVPITIPTLSEWGMGLFTMLLAAAGVMMMRRGRKA